MECRLKKSYEYGGTQRSYLKGLSDNQINERIKNGDINKLTKAPSRTLWQMVRANFFSVFTIINLVLASIVIYAGSPKNAIFAFVIIINSFIGISQEIKSKKTLEKLSVISMAHATVIRNSKKKKISIEELVKDDIVYLQTGDQVLADCIIEFSDELEVDESMITGESDPVYKKQSSKVLSGSFIVAGEGYARVINVGKETYSSKLSEEARKFKIVNSKLQDAISRIIKILLWLIVPIGICLMITQLIYTKCTYKEAMIGAVSGIVGMVPEGLVLLTSTTFIVSVAKLAKHHTLVQQLSATEGLARIDTLCLDKTGTLTEGRLRIRDIIMLTSDSEDNLNDVLSAFAHNMPSKNPTQQAILDKYKTAPKVNVINKIPFSSKRKWGGISTVEFGTYIIGAPEIILGLRYSDYKEIIEDNSRQGMRVLLIAKEKGNLTTSISDSSKIQEVALMLIEDVIRKEAKYTLEYFKKQKVDIKIISGDNPVTVSAVAKIAGVDNASEYVDARTLPISIDELKDVVDKYTVFGRVTPHQKKSIVEALKKSNHTVAMTGDGVNDVLAIKESDCGIAMANGSDATKAVAQLVLMDSNFASLPKVIEEGRKQIHNLEIVAELFLSKTVFFVIMAFVFCIIRMQYPILPIQSSLVSSLAIGLPALVLAMIPYKGTISKEEFFPRILKKSLPNGVVAVIFTTLSYMIDYNLTSNIDHSRSVSLLVFGGISIVILAKLCIPFNKLKSLIIVLCTLLFVLSYIIPPAREIFSLVSVNLFSILLSSLFIALSIPSIYVLRNFISLLIDKRFNKK